MQLETGNNVNNYQLSIRLILREPGARVARPIHAPGAYRLEIISAGSNR